jgi:hypothetical protein
MGFGEAAVDLGLRAKTGPGAHFSFADPERVRALLSGAGFGAVEFTPVNEPMLIGRDVDDVLEYERSSPSTTAIMAGLSPAQADEVTARVRDSLLPYVSPDGVIMPGAVWLVTAQAM